jgi:molybdenum cofactor cytidylyltransferase
MTVAAVSAVVPAAGRAERFGGGKLTVDIHGEPLLTHTVRSLLDGGIRSVLVIVSRRADVRRVALLDDPRVRVIANPDPGRGMFSSIQVGLAASADGIVLVLPGDMPFVSPATVAAVAALAAEKDALVLPVHAGRRGHPIALSTALRAPLIDADPASNLKLALAALGTPPLELAVEDPGILRDVDVSSDLHE